MTIRSNTFAPRGNDMRETFSALTRLPVLALLVASTLALSACGEDTESDEELSLRRQIGSMVVVGFRGMELDDGHGVVEQIRRGEVGGVVLFDRDVQRGENVRNIESPTQLEALTASLIALRPDDPPLIFVDQEGGRVARLKSAYGFPEPPPSAQELGEAGDPTYTREVAEEMGATLREMNFHVNLAPVVDVNVNPISPAIGNIGRSYSADPDEVATHAAATIEGLHAQGILSALKHFPGHGSATEDSHEGFTDITETWQPIELEPYRTLIEGGKVDLVMTAHVFHADLDPEWPATLSENVVQEILREQLGFDGPVISDDLQMGAILDHYDRETTIRRAILAGHDLLIFANNNPVEYEPEIATLVVDAVEEMIERGELDAERIRESHRRIEALKAKQKALRAAVR